MVAVSRSQGLCFGLAAALLSMVTGCVSSAIDAPAEVPTYVVAPPVGAEYTTVAANTTATPEGAAVDVEAQASAGATYYEETDPSALTDFREPLAPYGTWVNDPNYGTLWVPREDVVGADFQPYVTAGHWEYDTDYVWVSDYSWGWAPFHYGRWVYLSGHGWSWIPGRVYSGAWVSWRTAPGYGYVGWAPMAPSWYWFNGYAYGVSVGLWMGPRYSYCHHDYLFSRNVHHHAVRGRDAHVHDARTSTYTPANPRTNSRTPANPSVDSRTAANPRVDPRTPADPSVNPAAGAGGSFAARGPSPASLGIPESKISRVADSANVAKAREFAAPSTAIKAGGHAPGTAGALARGDVKSAAGHASSSREGKGSTMISSPRPTLDPPLATVPRYAASRPAPGAAAANAPTVLSTQATRSAPTVIGVPSHGSSSQPTALPSQLGPSYTPRASTTVSPSEFAARARVSGASPSLSAPSSSTYRGPTYSTSASARPSLSAPSSAAARAPSYSAPSSRPSFSSSASSSASSRPSSVSRPSFSSSSSSRSFSSSSSSSSSRSFSSGASRSSGSRSTTSSGSRSFSSSRGRR